MAKGSGAGMRIGYWGGFGPKDEGGGMGLREDDQDADGERHGTGRAAVTVPHVCGTGAAIWSWRDGAECGAGEQGECVSSQAPSEDLRRILTQSHRE